MRRRKEFPRVDELIFYVSERDRARRHDRKSVVGRFAWMVIGQNEYDWKLINEYGNSQLSKCHYI